MFDPIIIGQRDIVNILWTDLKIYEIMQYEK